MMVPPTKEGNRRFRCGKGPDATCRADTSRLTIALVINACWVQSAVAAAGGNVSAVVNSATVPYRKAVAYAIGSFAGYSAMRALREAGFGCESHIVNNLRSLVGVSSGAIGSGRYSRSLVPRSACRFSILHCLRTLSCLSTSVAKGHLYLCGGFEGQM